MNKKIIIKTLLSFWIIYHVLVIFVMPNSSSFLGRYFGVYLVPYANVFGLNSPWMFFSPNPAPDYHMNITLYPKGSSEPIEIQWPEKKKAILFLTPAIRNFYLMHFFVRSPQLIETLLVPWLCKQQQSTEMVNINISIKSPPSLDKARFLTHDELKHSYEEVNYFEKTYSCI